MALFKICKGKHENLPVRLTDGYAYFCTDTEEFFIDHADAAGTLHRSKINAKEAEILSGASLVEAINNSKTEIPTSSAVFVALANKVDKVSGKGLSTNDFTTVLKTNYDKAYTHSTSDHAPSNAEKNVIVGIQKNGTDVAVDGITRKVNITVPTQTSQLTNDSEFVTSTYVDDKIASVVNSAPETLDTLDELAAALGDDPNFATTVANQIGTKVPNTRKVNGKALSSDITLGASDVSALPIGGGTLTGNLTGKYITGTWLQTTQSADLGKAATKIAVLDNSGCVYYRTAEELGGDIATEYTDTEIQTFWNSVT